MNTFNPLIRPQTQKAWQHFLNQGLPDRRQESYKYTDLSRLLQEEYHLPEPNSKPIAVPSDLKYYLFFQDGRLIASELPTGISVTTLNQEYAGDLLHDPMIALNHALNAEVVSLTVAPGIKLHEPVYVWHAISAATQAVMMHPQLVVEIGEGSVLRLVHRLHSENVFTSLINFVSYYHLAAHACLEYVEIAEENSRIQYLHTPILYLAAGAELKLLSVALGFKLMRLACRAFLLGEKASADLRLLSFATREHHTDFDVLVHHQASHTESHQVHRAIADNGAKSIFTGKIWVHPHIAKIVADQHSQAMLLSNTAEVINRPLLQIDADDVICRHGAAIGDFDETMLFYLQSRGLSPEEARRLLTEGFFNTVFDPKAQLEDLVEPFISAKIVHHFNTTPS